MGDEPLLYKITYRDMRTLRLGYIHVMAEDCDVARTKFYKDVEKWDRLPDTENKLEILFIEMMGEVIL